MSLIICSECGKEFSDKASSCPNCGCPTEEILKEISAPADEMILKEIYTTYPSKAYGIKEYMKRTSCSMSEAKKIIGDYYDSQKPAPTKFAVPTQDRLREERLAEEAERKRQQEIPNKITCPKCHSENIKIFDSKKKMSISKGLIGASVLGMPGAIVGGAILGKQGKHDCVCMKCGNRWKMK